MQLIQQILIKITAKKVGDDEFGNSYYENSKGKRFVTYKGVPEPSKIPAHWHCWIHYNTDIAPVNIKTDKYPWQKIHRPNLTGTRNAYKPSNKSNKKYESWQPKN